jgi:ADP-ribosylarginine hydrolase
MVSLPLRYEAAMVLSGAGDALGYKNGSWEFCHHGIEIHKELDSLGGIKALKVKRKFLLLVSTACHLNIAP